MKNIVFALLLISSLSFSVATAILSSDLNSLRRVDDELVHMDGQQLITIISLFTPLFTILYHYKA